MAVENSNQLILAKIKNVYQHYKGHLYFNNPATGTSQQVSRGGGVEAKEECVKEIWGGGGWGGHACGFLFNFSKVTENAIMTIIVSITKLLITIGSPRAYLSRNRRAIT